MTLHELLALGREEEDWKISMFSLFACNIDFERERDRDRDRETERDKCLSQCENTSFLYSGAFILGLLGYYMSANIIIFTFHGFEMDFGVLNIISEVMQLREGAINLI